MAYLVNLLRVGAVDLGILQVVTASLAAWRWAGEDELTAHAGDLLGWCTMLRVWLRQAAAAGTEPIATGLDGLRTAEITVAMLESAQTGRRIDLT